MSDSASMWLRGRDAVVALVAGGVLSVVVFLAGTAIPVWLLRLCCYGADELEGGQGAAVVFMVAPIAAVAACGVVVGTLRIAYQKLTSADVGHALSSKGRGDPA